MPKGRESPGGAGLAGWQRLLELARRQATAAAAGRFEEALRYGREADALVPALPPLPPGAAARAGEACAHLASVEARAAAALAQVATELAALARGRQAVAAYLSPPSPPPQLTAPVADYRVDLKDEAEQAQGGAGDARP